VDTPRREIVLPRGVYIVGAILITGYVMYWLRGILTPILLAFIIAYVLDPVVDQLEAWRVPRPAGIAIVLATVLGVLALFLALVLPSIATEVAGVVQELPRQLASLWARVGPWLEQRGVAIPHSATELIEHLSGYASTVASSILAPARSVLTTLMGGTLSFMGSAFAAVVVLVLAVYLLNDFNRIIGGVRELIPLRWRATVTNYAAEIDQILSHFLRGQLTVMAVLAVLYGSAYALLGVRLAVPIGIAAGMLNFIPYLGGAFALTAGVLMSLLGGWHTGQLVGVVLAYTVVQTLEGFVITPRIIGKTVGLPEIWVLVALFLGGEIFGFLGVLLAVPAAAVAKIFVTHAVQYYRATELYLETPPNSGPDRSLASHEDLGDASHADHGREFSTPPRSEREET
jgi:predicted PurR-regulated permease PerM